MGVLAPISAFQYYKLVRLLHLGELGCEVVVLGAACWWSGPPSAGQSCPSPSDSALTKDSG